ncbi:hypothetical protein PLICRDRAFT_700984 [Plicaturopsis crispa FD-325 SS-3]|nr:hypothetical protein PLICRDRAFT_700984 [Plicaturopsis crispa FD-325 SS-3]
MPSKHDLPSRLILKLVDHRFSAYGLELSTRVLEYRRWTMYSTARCSWTLAARRLHHRISPLRSGTSAVWGCFEIATIIPCPYTPGATLRLEFTPEGFEESSPVDVRISKTFEPFTVAQCLLVEPTSSGHNLPPRLILKLVDHRFSTCGLESSTRGAWNTALDAAFKDGFKRVRSSAIENTWRSLGGPGYGRGNLISEDPEWEHDWMPEMNRWDGIMTAYRLEVAAYRYLQPLQGRDIPRLYGTCRYRLPDASEDIDPMIAYVSGLLLEYIDGQSMDNLTVGKDLTEHDAERASLGLLRIIRRLRALRSLHNDIAPRNVIVRRNDFDHPVLIDFGSASVKTPDKSNESWDESVAGCHELLEARNFLEDSGWHNPSPWRWDFERSNPLVGHRRMNRKLAEMRPDWRDQKFEFIPGLENTTKIDENGKEYQWEPLRWRIKPGVKTCDDDM